MNFNDIDGTQSVTKTDLSPLKPHILYDFLVTGAFYYSRDKQASDIMKLELSTTTESNSTKFITVWQTLPKNNDRPKFVKFVKFFLTNLGLDTNKNLMEVYKDIPSLTGKHIQSEIEYNIYEDKCYYNLVNIYRGAL